MVQHPYVDRYIDLMNITSRADRAAVYLSLNHVSTSSREIPRGGGVNLGQRSQTEPSGRGGESRTEERTSRRTSLNYTINIEQREHLARTAISCRKQGEQPYVKHHRSR